MFRRFSLSRWQLVEKEVNKRLSGKKRFRGIE